MLEKKYIRKIKEADFIIKKIVDLVLSLEIKYSLFVPVTNG